MGCGSPFPPPSIMLAEWDVANESPDNNYSGSDYFKAGLLFLILALFFLPRGLGLNPIRRIAQLRRRKEKDRNSSQDGNEFADWDKNLAGENANTADPDAISNEEMRALRAGLIGKMAARTTSRNGAIVRKRAR
ncbi:hypothetical protein GGR55DRAFT_676760 [Xylaria sp. FL0064]|nr:hypothetical protein GGR55DRAFT_676760 [Xylaria sp. FL0064]